MTADLALLAERRSGLAALLGVLLLEEPGPGIAELVRDVPSLAPLGTGDPAVAVEYERMFLRGVPLYESGFRSEDGQHGGPATAAVVDRYERVGFTEYREGRWRVASPDHLGLELRCYASLCREEANAWRSDTADAAMQAVEAERSFLADHLAAWAPVALRAAARLAGDGCYRPLLDAISAFQADEHQRLRPAPSMGAPITIEALPDHLGPARLGRLLLAPASCGMWLATADIEVAALAIGVPWRRSDTRTGLRHVIEAAVDSSELVAVLGVLRPVIAAEGHACGEQAVRDPGNAAHWTAWAGRAATMVALLDRLIVAGSWTGRGAEVSETLVITGVDAAVLADAVDRVVNELRAGGYRVDRGVDGFAGSMSGDRAVD